ncbi:hypothetical protein QJS04_geneDACA013242 [Acorus gramineus]|uniref:VOC domain-containing protein n=1 Tax=Acorus gramineus TaxID=55184 RepID=A0AAV9BDA6_ACOGR|nr:hypothetical protein QJS04_geneDACA013242 [Acorus gramineus]
MGIQEEQYFNDQSLPLLSLNHVSFVCKSVIDSAKFYQDVLGFVLIKRPSSFKFEGAWLFNYGIGIHLLQSSSDSTVPKTPSVINPKDNHISFQCTDINLVKTKLEEMGMKYVSAVVEEGGIQVDQLFFHDPDGYMIEICDCQKLPVLPLSSCPLKKPSHIAATKQGKLHSVMSAATLYSVVETNWMMENLITEIIDITF